MPTQATIKNPTTRWSFSVLARVERRDGNNSETRNECAENLRNLTPIPFP